METLPQDIIDVIVRQIECAQDRRSFLQALGRPWTMRNVQDVSRATLNERKSQLTRLARRSSLPCTRCLVHECQNTRISFLAWLRPRVMTRGMYYCAAHVDADLLASAELFATEDDRLELWR